jgi:hypothetical protein
MPPRPPEPDEAPAVDGLSDNEVVIKPFRDTLRGPDELRCRWAPWDDGRGRGWVAFTDPFSGEEIQVPTKYIPAQPPPWVDPRYVPDDVVAECAPQTFVYRAMDAKNAEQTRRAVGRAAPPRPQGSLPYDPEGGL